MRTLILESHSAPGMHRVGTSAVSLQDWGGKS